MPDVILLRRLRNDTQKTNNRYVAAQPIQLNLTRDAHTAYIFNQGYDARPNRLVFD